ncbi:FAD-binding PCMH-type domain-containing protein [Fusarium sp. LHS14.1]|nr:FAD-binding PCMH-type domain-containing protein [Fusarium sp. LHS14.1]
MARSHRSLATYLAWCLATANVFAAPSLKSCLLASVNGQTERARFSGDTGFQSDHVRPYKLNFPYDPFAIVYPIDASEVSSVVVCASKYSRKIQARSGGHDYTNKGIGGNDGAVVVDLKHINDVQVESTGVAKAGAGNRLKDVCEKLHSAGKRYMPHGSSPTVGIGGHATVGGLGLHSRLLGTSIDVMTSAEIVLANGTVVTVSKTQHPDIFWALRGAGASFGIVTNFYFQTYSEPAEVVNFAFTVSSEDPAQLSNAFKAYHEITTDKLLDPRFSSVAIIGKGSVIISGVFLGTEAGYKALNFDSRIPGITERNIVAGLSWMGHMNRTFDSISNIFPDQSYFYAKDTAIGYSSLPSNDSIDSVFEHLQNSDSGSKSWFVLVDLYGGAVNDVSSDATAFPHRNLAYFFALYAQTESETSQTAHEFADKAVLIYQGSQPEKYLSYAGYTNLRIKGSAQRKYWGSNLARLEKIKSQVDPKDIFSTPQGVKPLVK